MTVPVFLYNDPHPVHERMAERIGAEFVACSQGGLVSRMRAGRKNSFGNRPVLIEGGVPLVEAAFTKLLGTSGPVVELAADATLIDIVTPLEGRPSHERLAHRFGERFVDATIAVSDRLAAHARRYDRPVRVVHPFVREERYTTLMGQSLGGEEDMVLCVGKYRHKNGQDLLLDAAAGLEGLEVHFAGSGTENISETTSVYGHGFVSDERLYDLFDRARVIVFPARVGAYPVAVLEGLVSGTPVVTTPYVGNADLVRALHPRLISEPTPAGLEAAIRWALDREGAPLGERGRAIGQGFQPEPHLTAFEEQFNQVLAELGER